MKEYKTVKTDSGHIIQSGIPSGDITEINWEALSCMGFITRAVVLKTYYADDESWNERGWAANGKTKIVACDVRTYGKRSRVLRHVPVVQRTHSLHDEDVYVPRDSNINISGGSLVTEANPNIQHITQAENLDGDHVLLTFLEGDPSQPIILPFMFPHPNSIRRLKEEDGRIKRIRHNGVMIEWDKDGNLILDATETAKKDLDSNGEEISNVGIGGNILIKTKSTGDKLLSIKLTKNGEIHLGSDPNVEPDSPLVLGTEWIDLMGRLIDAILALTVGTGVGPSTTPINYLDFQNLKTEIQSKEQVSNFIFTKKSLD